MELVRGMPRSLDVRWGLDVFCDGGSVNLETFDVWRMKSIWE